MYSISKAFFPELVLLIVAAALFLMGTSKRRGVRGVVPLLALLAMGIALVSELSRYFNVLPAADPWQSAQMTEFARYVKIISAAIGILLVLLSWPNNADNTAGPAVHFGEEIGEFFGLLLLSIMGLFLVAGANDMMLLFLGIELSSLPTYIMVSISRPLPVAQEAGVKYFFLGAMASAVMLMGFSYLYGTTGTVYLQGGVASDGTILAGVDTVIRAASVVTPWQMLAAVLLITGFAFKMVTVPLHMYAPDVYQGAATPVTALLSFVPKTA
ncbi:MAG: proton-conducting transporter membrane subunit, partial [Tepidisphaeraceae bacterium]